ncbi:colorectal cancer associated 2 isoform X2 [Amia ocellicauda]|uniref:colorectal cancer associated 2 isoform X2 n=1 Tax=Amia ocellicauda TaxID=2972642 RepID=UPI003464613F
MRVQCSLPFFNIVETPIRISQNHSSQIQEACSTTLPVPYYDCGPTTALADNNHFQQRHYQDNVCYDQIQMPPNAFDNQQFIDMILQNENFTNTPLPPAFCAQQGSLEPFHQGFDYYSPGMAPSSPSDSSNLPSPADYNSYSPPECYSSSSSCYGSPTRMDSRYSAMTEDYHHQHCSLQYCYCSEVPDHLGYPQYTQCATTDCLYPSAVGEQGYFRTEFATLDMCYL